MTYDLLLMGALVLPDRILDHGWIAVTGETISAVGTGPAPAAARVIDAGTDWIIPGLVDGQTHATSYKGLPGFAATSQSALAGGITTMVDMPYDNPDPLNTMARLDAKIAAAHSHSHCDVALYATVAPGQGTAEMAPLAEAGVCAFKLSLIESHPVRFPRLPADEILDILTASRPTGLPVGLHNEDQEIVRATIARHKAAGQITPEYHEPARPEVAELAATAQFMELGAATGAHVHIVHLSSPRGFEMVADYAARGVRATGELCVHYLHFDATRDVARLGARMKVSPPIRSGVIDGLWQACEDGLPALISSDHSSWPIDNKLVPSIFDAGAGIPGLETLGPSFYTDAAQRYGAAGAVRRLVDYMCRKPAEFFGLAPRKGVIAPGADADLVVLKRGDTRFDASQTRDGLNWSPYDGETFAVSVATTLRRGEIVWDGQTILSAPGSGRFVPRR
ncbi:amidohydrolase family protein [Salipiger sp. P9]|uniref:dihydroorotase n=1 Tax=Salipiger pentaromativorans TaxID=2943193 RepID=UPI0021570D56|nr:amidohydrolase family protein [Salipiger pentaromativorans]MCR8548976.1 amidohydrolase family protein [Salipiger pentaromativorans]